MGFFSGLFSRKDKEPEAHFETYDEGEDDIDMGRFEAPGDPDFKLAGMRVGIIYKDEAGRKTQRIIRLQKLQGDHYEAYIYAYCELRRENRTFLSSRILGMYDPSTGEVLGEAHEFFAPYLDEQLQAANHRYEQGRFRSAWEIIEALRHELQVLILIARADGRFVKVEQNALLRYATERGIELGIKVNDHALAVLRDWIKVQDPSEPDARLAIAALKAQPETFEILWEVSELIAEADGKVREEERYSIGQIKKAITAVAAGLD